MQNQDIGSIVIYKNNQLIAFNKPAGLAVQQDATADKCLLDLAEIYCKSPIHIIHRLDRPASGVVLFARQPGAQVQLNAQFQQRSIRKIYLAVVGNAPAEEQATLVHFLQKQHKGNRSVVTEEAAPGSKRAELKYRMLASSERYHLLEIELVTGRHHQIRAQLSAIGCPIKGDVKYGFRRSNQDRSIHLHAWKLGFQHPVSGEDEMLVAGLPADSLWDVFQSSIQGQA